MTRTTLEATITRRRALIGGVTCALASLVSPQRLFGLLSAQGASGAMTSGCVGASAGPNLYAFPGAGPSVTAIAVTWREQGSDAERDLGQCSKVRIHAGLRSWEFDVSNRGLSKMQKSAEISVFTGSVISPLGVSDGLVTAVVMELPARAIGLDGSADIWAEHDRMGSRRRIGTPFLSDLVAENESLAAIYHSSTPAEDRDVLMKPLATAIEDRLRANRMATDARSHGRRLASALLPDVLRYDSQRPTGFTFAAQNGRHPAESTSELVSAFLNRGACSAISVRPARQTIETFPYFRQMAAAV